MAEQTDDHGFRKYKNLLHQNHHQTHLHLENNPPEGMTSEDIRHMSEDDLLDMDCFLNEDVFGDDFGDEGFYIF